MATQISPNVQAIMGTLVMELLSGQLTDETIQAVDRIQRREVPEPLRDVVGYMHGMSTLPQFRNNIIADLLMELGSACEEMARDMKATPPPGQV